MSVSKLLAPSQQPVSSLLACCQLAVRSKLARYWHTVFLNMQNLQTNNIRLGYIGCFADKEIRILSNLAIYDHRSTTCRNISYLNEITGLYVLCESKWRVRAALPNQSSVPVETWRSSLLLKLLEIRNNYSYKDMKITYEQTNEMINSLCIS